MVFVVLSPATRAPQAAHQQRRPFPWQADIVELLEGHARLEAERLDIEADEELELELEMELEALEYANLGAMWFASRASRAHI